METSVREIRLSSQPDSAYFLRVAWEGRGLGSGFRVLLTDGQKAWTGAVSAEAVRSEAEDLEMQADRYVEELQEALTSSGGSAPFSFTLAPPPDAAAAATVTLTYEKQQKDISFRLGSVCLSAVSDPLVVVTKLLSETLQRGTELDLQNQNLEQENQRLRGEQERMESRLKLYAAAKDSLEAELFSRFVLVLNEKKEKLRSLQERAAQLEERSRGNHSEPTRPQQDEYGGTTDEEPEEEERSATSDLQAAESACPASSLDDSLHDITDVAPTRKRRFRHLEAPGAASTRGGRREATPTASVSPAARPPEAAAASSAEDLFDDF
ncbi:DNA repair protein XRCC4 [Salarias fasciatus]|uniref:DNA repair protein XRCC4 n=1 Tax=Salarias fasciatus TaxID=181472 RepID=UPI001176C9BC|nr:DNA repair protein XRCC4-like [Salarias fasciatus]